MGFVPTIILLAAVCNFWLGILSIAKKAERKRLNKLFAVFCFASSAWAVTNFLLIAQPSISWLKGIFWLQTTYAFGTLPIITALFWTSEICGKKLRKRQFILLLILALFFFVYSYLTPIKNLTPLNLEQLAYSGVEIESSEIFFYLYTLYIAAILGYIIFILTAKYRKSKELEKIQIGYVLIGAILYIGTVLTVAFFLPALGIYQYSMLDSASSLFFIIFSVLAISRYHLFQLKVILTEILVVAMGISLLIVLFNVQSTEMIVLTSIIFLVFCFCGYLLLKSAFREVKHKETLEKKVKVRTEDLEQARNLAEIRARDLEKAKDIAEDITQKLKDRNVELEKFYRLTVGREIKMIDLKNEIKDLEKRLEKLEVQKRQDRD